MAAITKVFTHQDTTVVFVKNADPIAQPYFYERWVVWLGRTLNTPKGILLIAKATKDIFTILEMALESRQYIQLRKWAIVAIRLSGYSLLGLKIPLFLLSLPTFAATLAEWNQKHWTDLVGSVSQMAASSLFVWDLMTGRDAWLVLAPFLFLIGDFVDLSKEEKECAMLLKVPPEKAAPQLENSADRQVALAESKKLELLRVTKLVLGTLSNLIVVWDWTAILASAPTLGVFNSRQYKIIQAILSVAESALGLVISYYRATMLEFGLAIKN